MLRRGEKSKGGKIKSKSCKTPELWDQKEKNNSNINNNNKKNGKVLSCWREEPRPKAGGGSLSLVPPEQQDGAAPAEDPARNVLHCLSEAFQMLGSGKSANLSLPGGAKSCLLPLRVVWFFFLPCSIFLGSKATAGPQRARSWAIKFPITYFCFLCSGI